jgi:hypothetical protein
MMAATIYGNSEKEYCAAIPARRAMFVTVVFPLPCNFSLQNQGEEKGCKQDGKKSG